jgi:cytochrome c-type biogenesis protein CcmH
MKRWWSLGTLLLLAALLTGVAYAQESVSDDEVNAVAKKLYCPVCENTPLDVCPTQACKDWRALIRQQLAEGQTEEQIVDYFVARFGKQVLAQPPASGFTTLVWVLPLAGLVGGSVFLWRLLRRWQNARLAVESVVAKGAPGPPGIPAEVLARIERDVEERF